MTTGLFELDGKEYELRIKRYAENHRLAILLYQKGSLYINVSVNLAPPMACPPYQFYVKEYAESREFMPRVMEKLTSLGWVADTGARGHSGFVSDIRRFELLEPTLRAQFDAIQ